MSSAWAQACLNADRRLVRRLARRYRRDVDLGRALASQVKDYEINDRCCRWITAAIMHRLSRMLADAASNGESGRGGLSRLFLRACLRGEARIYRDQTRARRRPAAHRRRKARPC